MTVLYLVGVLALRFMLAEPAPAREVLVDTLLSRRRSTSCSRGPSSRWCSGCSRAPPPPRLGPEVGALGW